MKRKTWNQNVIKKENKFLVLQTIFHNNPISRSDIAKITGLNKGTVSSLVTELIHDKIIYDSGPGKSSGGRRPIMLQFNQLAGYAIGIDLGVNYIHGIVTDLEGKMHYEKMIDVPELPYEQLINELFEFIDHLISSTPESPYGIIGIGIGVPGAVNHNGEIVLAPNLGWKHIDLKKILKQKYEVPVIIDNEANAGAYGEKKFGIGQKFDDLIFLSVGIGIGVGIFINGQLYKGSHGFSGEMGHMTINIHGEECRCGNTGCWELYASEQALLRNAYERQIVSKREKRVTLEDLLDLAYNNDRDVIAMLEEIGDYLGVGINSIINTFNPDQIIIGNRMAKAKQWLIEPLKRRIQHQSMPFIQNHVEINFSELHSHSSVLGAAAFSIENFLTNEFKKM